MTSLATLRSAEPDVRAAMRAIGAEARAAARTVANAPAEVKTRALLAGALRLREGAADILAANARDLAEEVAALPDPVGRILATFERPNELRIERVATPLGVVGVIYESRPNVTADAGALCLKSGNAVVLRGGSD